MRKIQLEIVIPKKFEGKRLDLALSKLFPEHSRSRIQSWIKAGEVEVNNSKYKQRNVVNSGDFSGSDDCMAVFRYVLWESVGDTAGGAVLWESAGDTAGGAREFEEEL